MTRIPNVELRNVLPPGTYTSTGNGTGVDISDLEDVVTFVQDVGVVGGTTPSMVGTIEDSADNSSFAAVSGLAFTAVTTSTNHQEIDFDKNKLRKFVRWVRTITGTSPTFAASGGIIGYKKYQ